MRTIPLEQVTSACLKMENQTNVAEIYHSAYCHFLSNGSPRVYHDNSKCIADSLFPNYRMRSDSFLLGQRLLKNRARTSIAHGEAVLVK